MNHSLNYRNTHFITSAQNISYLPPDTGIEIAFAGRSNAGKSSSINRLCDQKKLVYVSKTPGRTQLINLFKVGEGYHIVDLPGYGYAQVPLALKLKWQKSLGEYLQKRDQLKGLVVLMDIRHPLRELDQQLICWAVDCNLPMLTLLTKCDKFKKGARNSELKRVREAVLNFGGNVQVELYSSLKGIGVDMLRKKLDSWYFPYSEICIDKAEGVDTLDTGNGVKG
ncbi:ribosome biogenesis GTP-binding protein YihA/YsxC [Candidatus Enterovibrio escicola]|uniref:ribosome biogenesis GTP-binding protein YihA/YsxC n=1 Tax=Candidatus Enterovibrio escicola TaxID=1927127 RepID=UPI00123800B6|nr:ribosome biogenesis GTP-binding protein YihA/YsxC [Candidatus Enterovibrio escacola]